MKRRVEELKSKILEGDSWMMIVEKRRYTSHHKVEIIDAIAPIVDGKVDLEDSDRVLRIDIVGRYAGISILRKGEVFSLAKPYPD